MAEVSIPPSLAVLLTVAPGHPAFLRGLQVVQRALDRGWRIYFFALDEGVRALSHQGISSLRVHGVKVMGCAYAAERRRLPIDATATYGGLGMLHDLLAACEHFVSVDDGFDEKNLDHSLQ
jgi:hypothetical protein